MNYESIDEAIRDYQLKLITPAGLVWTWLKENGWEEIDVSICAEELKLNKSQVLSAIAQLTKAHLIGYVTVQTGLQGGLQTGCGRTKQLSILPIKPTEDDE